MRSLLFAVLFMFSIPATFAASEDPLPTPKAEVVKGVSIFVSFNEGQVTVSQIADHIVITGTSAMTKKSDAVETIIQALKKTKDDLKKEEKNKPKSADSAIIDQYKPSSEANLPDKNGLLTYDQFLIARSQSHISAAFDDPHFVWTCKGGKCNYMTPGWHNN